MSVRNSRDNLIANGVQQASGLALLLTVPFLLDVHEYAQITFVSAMLSLMSLSDLGMSNVYSQRMPAIYAEHDEDKIQEWNVTILWFKVIGAILFGVVVSTYYWSRYHHTMSALILFLFVPIASLVSFRSIQATVKGEFNEVRNFTVMQSLTRLLLAAGAAVSGVAGWMAALLLSALAMFANKELRTICSVWLGQRAVFNWVLIRRILLEGVVLALIATLWLQLLSFGRLYAAINYSSHTIAEYGISGSVYQMAISLIIAAFVPQNIKTLRLLGGDVGAGVDYVLKVAAISIPVVFVVTVVGVVLAPLVFDTFFAKYQVQPGLYLPLLLSLVTCSIVATFGTLLIGTGKSRSYLVLLFSAFVLAWLLAYAIQPNFQEHSAAVAQMLSLSIYSALLLIVIRVRFRAYLHNNWRLLIFIGPIFGAPLALLWLS